MERVGPDTVHREGRRVIVRAAREMPDWTVSSFRRAEIRFEGEPYFVCEASRDDERRFRYVLEPWPADLYDRPSHHLTYDAEYVALRDGGRARAWIALLLWPLQMLTAPALGCLWNRTKRRLERHLGLNSGRATRVSLFCQYLVVLGLGLLAWLSLLDASLVGVSPFALFGAAMVLLADAVMRYDHLQKNPEDLLGVGEWLARFERGRR